MRNVLAAVRLDACAQSVLDTAIALAKLFDGTAVALHVREPGITGPEALTEAAGVELHEVSGAPIEQIVAAASERETVAVVLGVRGAPGGARPGGHTALQVITQVTKPVAVVPPQARPSEQFARLLVPLEGTSESSRALDDTIRLAHRHQLEILVLHVHSPATVPAFSNHEPHNTHAWNQEFLMRHVAVPHENVKLLRHLGVPADDVVVVAEETSADLIVLAWSQQLGEGHAHVVSKTIARSSIPVLLLPALVSRRRRQLAQASP